MSLTDTGASYRLHQGNADDVKDFETWTPIQFAEYVKKAGLGDYAEILINHKISGRLAPLLTDIHLQEMGFRLIGDRLRMAALIQTLGRKVRFETRTKPLWEGIERIYFSDLEELCCTMCGLCPDDPSTYKLSPMSLKIKKVDPLRCGPIRCCCCFEYSINNIDLTKVNDVDIVGQPAPCVQRVCCCAAGKELIEIQTPTENPDGKVTLVVKMGEGEAVANIIMQQVEEAQIIERE